MPSTSRRPVRRTAGLFDLRRIIGGLFVLYGLTLTALGVFDSQEVIDRAAGVNVNLWAGVGMLAFGLLMIAWALARPMVLDDPDTSSPDDAASHSGGHG